MVVTVNNGDGGVHTVTLLLTSSFRILPARSAALVYEVTNPCSAAQISRTLDCSRGRCVAMPEIIGGKRGTRTVDPGMHTQWTWTVNQGATRDSVSLIRGKTDPQQGASRL